MSTLSLSPTTTRKVLAAIVAFLLVSLAIIRTSDAAFTAETSNEGNYFTAGGITLTDNFDTPMFEEDDLVPGDVAVSCIEITYTGSVDPSTLSEVDLAVVIGSDTGLAAHLDVEADVTDACGDVPTWESAGVLSGLAGSNETGWTPSASPETRAFHFRVTVGENAPQNASASGINLTWSIEASNS